MTQKWVHTAVITRLAVYQPAEPLTVVVVGTDDIPPAEVSADRCWVRYEPVMAVEAAVVRSYSRPSRGEYDRDRLPGVGAPADLREAGFRCDQIDDTVEHRVVTLGDCGPEEYEDAENTVSEVVLTRDTPLGDERIADLKRQAVDKCLSRLGGRK